MFTELVTLCQIITQPNLSKLPTLYVVCRYLLSHHMYDGLESVLAAYGKLNRNESLLVQACLRAPLVVADEAKLAIVFTYFFLLLFSFFFLRLLLFTHFGESPVRENLFPPIFWHN